MVRLIGNTCARWPRRVRRARDPYIFTRVSLSLLLTMFTMDRSKPAASAVCCLRGVLLLLLVNCNVPLLVSSPSNALLPPDEFTYPYSSIFSPLLRALSEHGGSRWNPGQRRKVKPERRYMRYLTEVYKKPSRGQRSVVGDKVYNTIRLIKPQDECVVQSSTGE